MQIVESNVDELIPNIETPAFGYEKKLIIVKNANILRKKPRKKNKKDDEEIKKPVKKEKNPIHEYLEKNVELIKEGTILVIIEDDIDKTTNVFKNLEDNASVCEFKELTLPALITNLKRIFKMYKVNIKDSTIRYIIEKCGTEMQVLINEIRKLIEYAGTNGVVTENEVDLLCTKKIESSIFDLTDNLGAKNITKALQTLDDMLYNKEPIQKILVILYGHFKKLYIYKLSKKKGRNTSQDLNLKPNATFLIGKYDRQARCFKEEEIREILFKLIDLDSRYKIGNIDPLIGLESLLCKYCEN